MTEKQIPKKPADKFREYDSYYGVCPCCDRAVADYEDLDKCLYCGQALDWSDAE